ncbi:MAG TPA: hypothetical protein VLF91_03600 [Candidatus Saccharimonadales bacterium]|nr:hypothetical protein [Candidatus Saccharimonadales bacterium]
MSQTTLTDLDLDRHLGASWKPRFRSGTVNPSLDDFDLIDTTTTKVGPTVKRGFFSTTTAETTAKKYTFVDWRDASVIELTLVIGTATTDDYLTDDTVKTTVITVLVKTSDVEDYILEMI